jgi:hypothetical protein
VADADALGDRVAVGVVEKLSESESVREAEGVVEAVEETGAVAVVEGLRVIDAENEEEDETLLDVVSDDELE